MPSRMVSSNQPRTHPRLPEVVRKHLAHPWRRPLASYADDVFNEVRRWLAQGDAPLILDSGCGTGVSSLRLARRHPDCRVLGFDRSATRLSRSGDDAPANCLLIRANALDLWRQLADAGIRLQSHYLLYPNPYPKAAQLNSRWHGSPALPVILSLGGHLELRTNWKTYVDEFSQALTIAGYPSVVEAAPASEDQVPLTPFEEKYARSGQTLWRLTSDLGSDLE